ncbi:MAG: polysaccharide deacetylase family protein [Terracidiphilus sp.]|nr:polysaccharide deacetylase family protein [Terracidiphilus sp.]
MFYAIETGAAVLGAAGLAAGGYAYAAMWPGSQVFGKTLIAPKKPGELALTFDDGPNPAWTPQLLDALAAHRVQATFFMLGKFAAEETELVKRVAAAGHLVGCHSWDHPNLARTGKAAIEEQLRRTKDTLEQIVGQEIRFFRPPYGARRPYALKAAREMGLVPVTWNAMTNDWAEPDARRIAARLEGKIDRLERWWGRAANIVLHDGGHRMLGTNREPSVKAARLLLERYALTHLFVRLDAWA